MNVKLFWKEKTSYGINDKIKLKKCNEGFSQGLRTFFAVVLFVSSDYLYFYTYLSCCRILEIKPEKSTYYLDFYTAICR